MDYALSGLGGARGRGVRRALPYANGLRPFRALHSGNCRRRDARRDARRASLHAPSAAIGYAELRFAPVPRRGIISIEKSIALFRQ
jgi:hypothetical protein